jgi:hypothetical protein
VPVRPSGPASPTRTAGQPEPAQVARVGPVEQRDQVDVERLAEQRQVVDGQPAAPIVGMHGPSTATRMQ